MTEDAASRRPAQPHPDSPWAGLSELGKPMIRVEECESTQLLIPADATEGTVALADFQSAGRGRLGRTWEAPRGTAIHVSIALRPPGGRPPQEHDPRRRPRRRRRGGARDGSVRPGQVAERRHAEPAQGRGSARRAQGRPRRPRDRDQRQPDARPAPARRTPAGRIPPHDHGTRARSGRAACDASFPARAPVRRLARLRPRRSLPRHRSPRLPARPPCLGGRTGGRRGRHRPQRPAQLDVDGERRLVESGEVAY